MVVQRSSAEMPVVVPWRKSTETVKAVRCGRIVVGDHRVEMKPPRRLAGERRADDAAGVADDEGELFRRRVDRREDQVGLVLAVVVVGDDDDLALRRRRGRLPRRGLSPVVIVRCPGSADLAAMPEIVVGEHDRQHRLADRHGADADAGVVAALGRDLDLLAGAVDRCGAG